MNRTSQALAVGTLGMMLGSGSAFAAFPASVVGTWNAVLNQSLTTLVITSQGTTGICRTILGTIQTTNIQGFYCIKTGRIFFLRKSQATNDTTQAYSGNLATDSTTDRMGGTFADLAGNAELGWSASR